ncbi:MAG: dUTP diphosphatase [Candidatus Aenigmatarchaeota archaeon]|nr:dUTP diphosphatase [Nanoarchaeota archaeon]
MVEIKVQRIDKAVEMPSYSYKHDAGLDLRSAEECVIRPGERRVVKTGIKTSIPENHVGLIWDKSGIASKFGMRVLAGVIDSGYRGEIGVVLINLGQEDFHIEKNMKIAQMLIQPVIQADIMEVENLEEAERGDRGFGSSTLK